MSITVIDQDFGWIEVPLATIADPQQDWVAPGFERVAKVADAAMIDVLREDWALAQLENLAAT